MLTLIKVRNPNRYFEKKKKHKLKSLMIFVTNTLKKISQTPMKFADDQCTIDNCILKPISRTEKRVATKLEIERFRR